MKKLAILLASIFITSQGYSQISEVKINVASAAVAVFNPSFELGIGNRSSLTFDYIGAFATDSYMGTGHPFLFSMGLTSYRYYLKKDTHQGFFVSGDFGLDVFRMNKNIIPLVANDKGDGYDVGMGYLFGVTAGYKRRISRRFSLEASVSGGWHHATHEGYDSDGVRYVELNASGEWLPYKGGLYLIYHL